MTLRSLVRIERGAVERGAVERGAVEPGDRTPDGVARA
jgi:hypothetical protein